MIKPKMIIFDYGNTLVYEDVNDNPKAFDGIYKLITKNEDNLSQDIMYSEFRFY